MSKAKQPSGSMQRLPNLGRLDLRQRAKTGADTREIEARLGPARDLLADAAARQPAAADLALMRMMPRCAHQ